MGGCVPLQAAHAECMGFRCCLMLALNPPSYTTGRSDPTYLHEVLGEAIKAGATTVNITDTVGYCLPHEWLVSRGPRQAGGRAGGVFVASASCRRALALPGAAQLGGPALSPSRTSPPAGTRLLPARMHVLRV